MSRSRPGFLNATPTTDHDTPSRHCRDTRIRTSLTPLQALAADAWGCNDLPVRDLFAPMTDWLSENVPSVNQRYPPMWRAKKHLSRIVRNILLSVSRVCHCLSKADCHTVSKRHECWAPTHWIR